MNSGAAGIEGGVHSSGAASDTVPGQDGGGGYNLTWQFSWVISVLLTSRSDLLNAHGLGMHDYSYGGLRKYSRRCMASGNIRCHVLVQQEVDTSTFASTETGVGVSGSQEFWEAGLQLQVRSW